MVVAATQGDDMKRVGAITPVLVVTAFWPVWHWYALRTMDRSDEPWGLLALATAGLFLWLENRGKAGVDGTGALSVWDDGDNSDSCGPGTPPVSDEAERQPISTLVGISSLLGYILTFSMAPPLVQSLLLVITIWCLVVRRVSAPSKSGILGLLILALPLIPSINFFAGYPIRLLVASGTALMLNCVGLPVHQDGVMLSLAAHQFAIDAPCSGINMLWAEAYVAMTLICLFRLNPSKSVLLGTISLIAIVLGNILRATSLVLLDLIIVYRPVHMDEQALHFGTGVLVFLLITLAVLMTAERISRLPQLAELRLIRPTHPMWSRFTAVAVSAPFMAFQNRRVTQLLVPLCIAAAITPFVAHPSVSRIANMPPPKWPTAIDGIAVVPVESLAEEQAFAADFPGYMKRFTDGHNSYFVRVVNHETRQLHPSSDCFRGLGYEIEPQPIMVSQDGEKWSSFDATKSGHTYRIRERIYDDAGNSWTDVSQWYWQAVLSKTPGPWWDVTIAEPRSSL